MNTFSKYITFAAVAMMFASCSQEEVNFYSNSNDMVQISSAHIAVETTTRVNSIGEGNVFEDSDQILLVNNSRTNGINASGVYTATVSGNTTSWAITEGVVLWAQGNGNNDFTAYYPATKDFVLPADQSTEEGIKSADRMIATAVSSRGNTINLSFSREMARVTFVPTFVGGLTTIESFNIATKDANTASVAAYADGNNFTAILTPGTYAAGEAFASLVASTATQEFSFVAKSDKAITIEAGKSYTFNIEVGKDIIAFTNIQVQDWVTSTLGSADAELIQIYKP